MLTKQSWNSRMMRTMALEDPLITKLFYLLTTNQRFVDSQMLELAGFISDEILYLKGADTSV